MTRLLLATLLSILCSGPAYAEWLGLVKNDRLGTVVYVDPDTIRRKGDLAKMWSLNDYKTGSSDGSLSTKQQVEYDCTEERMRVLAIMGFSGNMGSGTLVSLNSAEGVWIPLAPDSVGGSHSASRSEMKPLRPQAPQTRACSYYPQPIRDKRSG